MSDIFISYASEDRPRARALAEALAGYGWSVWWDRRIPAGKDYAEVIEAQLTAARCVIVLWSKESVKSAWVKTEAADALDRGVLVPALIDAVKIPLEFRRFQAADLVGWEGGAPTPGFETLVGDLTALLGRPPDEGDRRSAGAPAPAAAPPAPPGANHGDDRPGGDAGRDPSDTPLLLPLQPGFGSPVIKGAGRSAPPPRVSWASRHPRLWTPPVLIGAVCLVALLLVGGYTLSQWRKADNRNGRGDNSANQAENRNPAPNQNGGTGPGGGNPDMNRNRNDPAKGERLKNLVGRLDHESEVIRKEATATLAREFPGDPQAVSQVLDLIIRGGLSPQGLVNALFFLNKTDDAAWTDELLQKFGDAHSVVKNGRPGAQAAREMNSLTSRVSRVRESRGGRPTNVNNMN